MTTRTRRGPRRFSLRDYSADVERFHAELSATLYRQWAGIDDEAGLPSIYQRHADLYDTDAIHALREAAGDADAEGAAEARELLAFAVEGHLAAAVAEVSERIDTAEARAVIMWRNEPIPYRAAWNRAADLSLRPERNGLAASYFEAVEAINPLRQERFERIGQAVAALGYRDLPDVVRQTAGFDPQELAADQRAFLADSETIYFAALRRYLAEIDIEQGDAARIDLERVLRGAGWDSWFPGRGLLPALRSTLAGMGLDPEAGGGIRLDLEDRPRKSPRAFCAPLKVPGDVRLVVRPRGGWDDYAAVLHEAGHAQHFAHVDAQLPVAFRLLGDNSLTEAYGALLELLVGDPAWLTDQVGMPEADALAFADFNAFWQLVGLRGRAARLIYELYLYDGTDASLAREQYAGMVGLTIGVRVSPAEYLASVDDNLYVARYIRAFMLQGSLSAWLRARFGETWWRSPDAGEALRRSWSRGQQWNARDVLAHLGYDHLDWRPVLRQIRTRLIGEMSGYGGPNITTRAGTRKV